MITREQARDIAARFLRERGPLPGWDGVERVLSPEEWELAALGPALGSSVPADAHVRRCWAALVRGTAAAVIHVSRDSGEVEFAGAVRGEPRPRSG